MMRMIDDGTGLEVLNREQCLRLLRAHAIGRVAVVARGRPLIFPVMARQAEGPTRSPAKSGRPALSGAGAPSHACSHDTADQAYEAMT